MFRKMVKKEQIVRGVCPAGTLICSKDGEKSKVRGAVCIPQGVHLYYERW